jgi:2-amino-4-hydroxy-6-hydroxymethyldihydropteridine diphosphokinase
VAETAYLSLGSNLGDRVANLREATRRLGSLGAVTAVSSLYETEPVEVESGQPWYVNCAVALKTDLTPQQVLEGALAIERSMGRVRTGPRQPRKVDIDILLFGEQVIRSSGLTVPHPAMHHRRFVLEPLTEIASEARHPVLNRTVRELKETLPFEAGAVRRLTTPASGDVR